MKKQVILITGTPKTGKTTISQQLARKLEAEYINLTELALKEHLTLYKDTKRDTTVIDPTKIRKRLTQIIKATQKNTIIIDGHYAASVTPKTLVTHTIILRRDPQQLKQVMQQAGYKNTKVNENLAAEILDTPLKEALDNQDKRSMCEIDTTNKTPQQVTTEILKLMQDKQKCRIGIVDWLTKLETEGKLDDYLKI